MTTDNTIMKYDFLGRTGVRVSKLCLGTMNFGGRTPPEESKVILDKAIEAGINFIDTANVYGHDPKDFPKFAGRSESIIGDYLEESGKRDQVFLASKMFFHMKSDDINAMGSGRYHIMREIEESLNRLKTDHVDLYQIHSPWNRVPIDETLRALNTLVEQNKVRYIGSSSFGAWQIVEAIWTSKELGLHRFVTEQAAYNLLDRRLERELIPMAQTYGLGILTWAPLAGGFLTGKYSRTGSEENTRYGSFWQNKDEMFPDVAYDKLEKLEALADRKAITLVELALSWQLHQPGITSVIIGPRTVDQLESNLKAASVELSAEDLEEIDQIFTPFEMTVPFYGPNERNGFGFIRWGPTEHRLFV